MITTSFSCQSKFLAAWEDERLHLGAYILWVFAQFMLSGSIVDGSCGMIVT